VVVGEDRYAAGQLAEAKFGVRIHLLDDGFQHRGLARDFDIVLVTPEDARDRLLPAGRLRESLQALRRADAVVLTSARRQSRLRLQQNGVAGAARDCSSEGTAATDHILRNCPSANFLLQLRSAGIDPVARRSSRPSRIYGEDIRDLLDLRQRAVGMASSPRKKTR